MRIEEMDRKNKPGGQKRFITVNNCGDIDQPARNMQNTCKKIPDRGKLELTGEMGLYQG
jgi:hypothetical protein